MEERAEREALKKRRKAREPERHASSRPRRQREDDDFLEMDEHEELPERRPRSAPRPAQKKFPIASREDESRPGSVGQVIGVHRTELELWIEGARLRVPLLRSVTRALTPVVGDEFVVAGDPARGTQKLAALVERRTVLARTDERTKHRGERLVAANLDVGIITVALDGDRFNVGIADRFLVLLWSAGIDAVLCINKLDLASAEERETAEDVTRLYADFGIPVVYTSAVQDLGVSELHAAIQGRTACFVGQSGVGKSSLTNVLLGELRQKVSEVRAFDGKGRHTTSASTLHRFADGTRVIDTPGVRSIGVDHLGVPSVELAFRDLLQGLERCRFRDCKHLDEPGCQVLDAVANGQRSRDRHRLYTRMVQSVIAEDSGGTR